jgi:hypothetical protein
MGFPYIPNDNLDEIPLPDWVCFHSDSLVQADPSSGQQPADTTVAPVRAFDGLPIISTQDLSSGALGFSWGQTRSWTGLNNASLNGNGWSIDELPYLVVGGGTNGIGDKLPGTHSDDRISVVAGGASAFTFVVPSSGPYTSFAPWGAQKIRLDWIPGPTSVLRLTDSQGNVTEFYDVYRDSGGRPVTHSLGIDFSHKYGRFKSYTPADGTASATATYDAGGYLTAVTRGDSVTGDTEQFVYTYALVTNDLVAAAKGTPPQLVATVTLQRPDGAGGWQPVQRVEYTYYTGRLPDGAGGWRNDPNGRLGDLELTQVENPVVAADGSLTWKVSHFPK